MEDIIILAALVAAVAEQVPVIRQELEEEEDFQVEVLEPPAVIPKAEAEVHSVIRTPLLLKGKGVSTKDMVA
jgi:hypothetical protein